MLLLLLSTQPDAVQAYNTPAGTFVQFRAEQALWGAFGLAAALALALAALRVATGSRP